jgi:hypothetical protein
MRTINRAVVRYSALFLDFSYRSFAGLSPLQDRGQRFGIKRRSNWCAHAPFFCGGPVSFRCLSRTDNAFYSN